jgi:hypothetical protein
MTEQFTQKEKGLEDRLGSGATGAGEPNDAGADTARMLPVHRGIFSEEIRDTFGQSAGSFSDFRAFISITKVDRMIARIARKWNVDPIAIMGAIVWEGFVNPRAASLRGAGLGKMHFREHWFFFEGEPLAKQLEDVGYLPPLSMEERQKQLLKAETAIEYIGASLHALSVLAEKYGHSMRNRPEILCAVYNKYKLDTWEENLANKPKGDILRTGTIDMGVWVSKHLGLLRVIYPNRTWFPIDVSKMDPKIRAIDMELMQMAW